MSWSCAFLKHYPPTKTSASRSAFPRPAKRRNTHLVQVAHDLVQRRRKGAVDVEKDAVRVAAPQLPPQVPHHLLEPPRRRDLAHVLRQRRRRPHGLEAHHDRCVGSIVI
ncbi:hypothetical protein HIM_05995 [Hirsutella minnesotensis 3608]|uniref:Uncharacterized protein n=1 Tax=Hirsutella minnesotensis 3608 TaxID=1043627 RepID=A0A0F7ZP02_9HYPO|nr:hypothetical protein HIM_05995 [Hirsutella minnesotensis 3608]